MTLTIEGLCRLPVNSAYIATPLQRAVRRFGASTHPILWGTQATGVDEPLVVLLGLWGDPHFQFAQGLDIVGICGAAPVAFFLPSAGMQLHCTQIVGDQRLRVRALGDAVLVLKPLSIYLR